MSPKYPHLLSPLKIRNTVLKNRLAASNSLPHFLQGPESYPADPVIAHYENKARGASMVSCMGFNNGTRGKQFPMELDMSHFPDFDLYDAASQNYMLELTDSIHFYQSLAGMSIFIGPPSSYLKMVPRNPNIVQGAVNGDTKDPEKPFDVPLLEEFDLEEIPAHLPPEAYDAGTLDKIADSYAEQAGLMKRLDFDYVSLHFAYRANLPAKFFSPITNHRTDDWGGSLENRMKFPLMVLKRVRERVGKDFLIEILWSAEDIAGGYTLDETVSFLQKAKEYIDIVQLRAPAVDPAHPTGFMSEETPFLHYAAYVKERVPGLVVATIGGYQDLDTCEKAIAEGKADLISMARAWISNPDFGRLALEGRNEDVVPCLRCNKCHGRGENDPFHSICSVNPTIGLEHKLDRLVRPSAGGKRVAVAGGGPAGLRCALYLADRGHSVTLFEASGELGGAIRHADYVSFKWPLKKFKDYLIRQVEKREAITVRLNTPATSALLAAEGFDVIISAVGAEPVLPPIPGLKGENVLFAEAALRDADALGRRVVVIGGGEVGVETGMHLAEHGHDVTVLEMRGVLAADTTKIHYRSMFEAAWEALPGFHGIVNAMVTAVESGGVRYTGPDGEAHLVPADSIVVSAGMRPKTDEALTLYGAAPEFYLIGDCQKPATIQQAMRSAYSVAGRI